MGFFKNVKTAFDPANLKRGLEMARNPPSQAEIDAMVAQMTPEQRAAYEANMAQVAKAQAESQQSWQEAQAINEQARVLEGPAGRYLYGASMAEMGSPDELQRAIAEKGMWGAMRDMQATRKGEFTTALRQTFNVSEVEQVKDPAQRAVVASGEQAARDAARRPYASPHAARVVIGRIATRGATQVDELLAHLRSSGLAARPDHVFGVYRVPDRISGPLTPHSEKGRVVEWDVVQTPLPDGAAGGGAPCVTTSFVAADRWVARRVGEPSVLDEDLALDFCLRAGIGPELCLGLARVSEFRTLRFGPEDDYMRTIVKGVIAVHPEEASGAYHRMAHEAPLELASPAEAGVHVEVLNWAEIGRAVHPKINHPPSVPSPFPYLPSTPQELLLAYLEVVGLQPSDCYSAQATVDEPHALIQGGLLTTNLGPRQPCADGEPRMRTHACEHVVVVYRDRPEYAEGRVRWGAYQQEVLQAHLERGIRVRPRVTTYESEFGTGLLSQVVRVAEAIDRIELIGTERLPPYRYCWPPAQ